MTNLFVLESLPLNLVQRQYSLVGGRLPNVFLETSESLATLY